MMEPTEIKCLRSSKKSPAPLPPSRTKSSPVIDKVIDMEKKHSQLMESNERKLMNVHINSQEKGNGTSLNCEAHQSTIIDHSEPSISHMSLTKHQTPGKSSSNYMSDTLFSELVDCVRSETSVSYDSSRAAVTVVISELRDRVPATKEVMETILQGLHIDQPSPISATDQSEDGKTLRQHFTELSACKDDSQQRSWFLHEDESSIRGHLQGILDIVENANPEICKRVMSEEQYDAIHNLVLYYQMEVRVPIRLLLLQVFGALCGVDSAVVSVLLNSVLPLELARDMQADTQDIQKFVYSSLVLVMICSMGEMLPVTHYDHLNDDFLQFLIDVAESPPDNDAEHQLPDLVTQILLAFNLHFQLPAENNVMSVLARQSTANNFMEKLMLLVNRETDPVRILPHEPSPPNSVLKFLSDMYSDASTANLMYTNDAKVLIDIVLRHLRDMCPGDKMRTEYLSLFHLILKSSKYEDHCHRRVDLQECLVRISKEEDCDADTTMDKLIVTNIWKDYSHLFEVM